MPTMTLNLFFLIFVKAVSPDSGPRISHFSFLSLLTAGIIIFFSSESFVNSSLCGFSPSKAILGLNLNFLKKIH